MLNAATPKAKAIERSPNPVRSKLTGGRLIPNIVAYVALFGWPAVCVILFVMLPVEAAAVWSLLGAYLLLPSSLGVDVHYLPPLDKSTIPAVTVFLLCFMKGTASPAPRRPFIIYVFALCFIVSPIFTSLNNSYELHIGDLSIPGFYPLDSLKQAFQNLIILMPFFAGIRFLSSDRGREMLIKSIPIGAIIYSLPMFFELRMSPQLQRMIYGSTSSAFIQLVRAGGYRPVVFLSTGLELALFMSMAFVAATIAIRLRYRFIRLPAGLAATYIGGLLLLCKSLGSILYAAAALPLVLWTKPKTWVKVSSVIVLIICAYPLLRTYDIIPVRRAISLANSVSAERSDSFQVRVINEDRLLAKANEKPFFGWGTWGRNRVFDKETGQDLSITDGTWIIRFGMFGWFGYLSLFGLFAASVLSATAGVRGPVTSSTTLLGALTLMLAINLTDLIPNANLLPLTYVLAGSVAGRVRKAARPRPVQIGANQIGAT